MIPECMRELVGMRDRQAAAIKLGQAFLAGTAEAREAVVRGWPFDQDWDYPSPWRLACVRGEVSSPQERLVALLVLNGLENKENPREQLSVFCIAYHSCKLVGLDPEAVFVVVADVLSPAAAEQLTAFLAREPADKALEAFFLEERPVEGGETEIRPVDQ